VYIKKRPFDMLKWSKIKAFLTFQDFMRLNGLRSSNSINC